MPQVMRSVGAAIRTTRLRGSGRVNHITLYVLGMSIFSLIVAACAETQHIEREIVMSEGMSISATTPEGTITVVAGKGFKRIYKWNGCEKSVILETRNVRWDGSYGIYHAGTGITWSSPCDGLDRAVVEEGQQHFPTVEDAEKWIRSRRGLSYVHRDDGLMVGWNVFPTRRELNVDVWQLYVNGAKPKQLSGSDNKAIRVSSATQPTGS